ncbi:MAG TPA: phosphomannose isomerase type II C-terminal cupin domain [Syntrophorhabdus sp.]|jgi:mannose-6-phosphate isomerase|nr:phosphomannose isomerase type II C-terminal cupin domain [Syntrophorhabdaceae bacterium]MDI9558794.1 phosphomannose isomerase type II C-terminal cupin domain [Pseudomonadota bacterium]OPX93899.1 MAG: Alginate biosynthesis protein AlgA [Syntrophorhabdus sp. PtaB.Bin027]OQB76033.1 MAG: Alginate biosynthesis protein AlgA [Deltaproteobacteria bacterium ADurb.Bin135]HNY70913.1 phosphomannose isomerase type II C-terminal cupin domain [Syntrophorhabdus sp.]
MVKEAKTLILEEDHRPWGYYQVISDEPDLKLKKIYVYPGKRLSLQRHQRRTEHWYILQGKAIFTLDSKEIYLEAGMSVDIPRGSFHRIMATGEENLIFIEVQTGDYFGEDDIERVEDDYGRVP